MKRLRESSKDPNPNMVQEDGSCKTIEASTTLGQGERRRSSLLTTARGSNVSISSDSYNRAQRLLRESSEGAAVTPMSLVSVDNSNMSAVNDENKSASINASTDQKLNTSHDDYNSHSLSNEIKEKGVRISRESLSMTKSMFDDKPEAPSINYMDFGKSDLKKDDKQSYNSAQLVSKPRLQTARGNNILISDESRRRAARLLNGDQNTESFIEQKEHIHSSSRIQVGSEIMSHSAKVLSAELKAYSHLTRPALASSDGKHHVMSLLEIHSIVERAIRRVFEDVILMSVVTDVVMMTVSDEWRGPELSREDLLRVEPLLFSLIAWSNNGHFKRRNELEKITSFNVLGVTFANNGDLLDVIESENKALINEVIDHLHGREMNVTSMLWTKMQLRWIVWTLASYERKYPSYFGHLLNKGSVVDAIVYRYQAYRGSNEIRHLEHVRVPPRVSAIQHFRRVGSMSPLQRSSDICSFLWPLCLCFAMNMSGDSNYSYEVTDGWWWTAARIDPGLRALISNVSTESRRYTNLTIQFRKDCAMVQR